ncbi:DNA helicase [Amylibacter cionae]|uniref:DNA 3'-5' helicase II n=2 Tax=Neptunicoccus cionae TaxID=2035344 RepID=A0A916VRT0_9RHOB|nr:DNA helicase [Amylibacter cionae]
MRISEADIDALESYFSGDNSGGGAWKFDLKRRDAIKGWMDVQACPGSGKTTLVATKLILLAQKWEHRNKGVCVLTHTNVAKHEIIEKMTLHPAGERLLSYPHFIGTIQEFVNKFLGLPKVRGKYPFTSFSDGDVAKNFVGKILANNSDLRGLYRNLKRELSGASNDEIRSCLGTLHFSSENLDLTFHRLNGSKVESATSSHSDRRKMLCSLKTKMMEEGLFNYRDMYAIADRAIDQNTKLPSILATRFPCWIVDEMQDTQLHQDNLLQKIIHDSDVLLQRLGDPDQAIFDGIGGGQPNASYNNSTTLHTIQNTHRFGSSISQKITRLSYNRIGEIQSERPDAYSAHPHTIFVFDDTTQKNVLNAFSELVAKCDPEGTWKQIKAVGASNGQQGHIEKYWADFNQGKSTSIDKPTRLIEILEVDGCVEGAVIYKKILDGIVVMLRSDGNAINSRSKLDQHLKSHVNYGTFRRAIASLLLDGAGTSENWTAQTRDIQDVIPTIKATSTGQFFDYAESEHASKSMATNNKFRSTNGREIEVATIHSVKGETHDATLVLETKHHDFDLEKMLPYLSGDIDSAPTGKRNIERMRRLFVGASRPRHLVCMAIHADHLSNELRAKLRDVHRWEILEL